MSLITNARQTHFAGSAHENIVERDVTPDMVLLEPDTNPLYVMTNNAKNTKGAIQPVFEWIEDAEAALWGQLAGELAQSATSASVTDGTIFAANDVIAFMLADTDSGVEELAIVTSVSGNDIGLIRNATLGGAATVSSGTAIRILGGAFQEGAPLGTPRTTLKSVCKSACQIFRTPVFLTTTMQATQTYMTEDEENYQLGKAMQRHRSEIEAAGLWGRYYGKDAEITVGAAASDVQRWLTAGFKSVCATNISDMQGTLTATKLNNFSETAFRYGRNTKLMIACPRVITAVNALATPAVRIDNNATVFGVKLNRYQTAHGTYLLANNFRLEDGVTSQAGFDDEAYVIDLDCVKMRYLNGNGKNLNTKLRRDVVKDGSDAIKHEYYSQVGWEIRHDKRHARILGVINYA